MEETGGKSHLKSGLELTIEKCLVDRFNQISREMNHVIFKIMN